MNVLQKSKQVQILSALVEGCGIRTVERLTNVHRDTVMRLGAKVGAACHNLHHELMHDLNVGLIELDEQWAFIGKKNKRVKATDSPELGDVWLFVAMAATQKAIISYVVGKRNAFNTQLLARDLRSRILNRPQITADGYSAYPDAIDVAFGIGVDFATLTKEYVAPPPEPAAHRYSPSSIRSIDKKVIVGEPDMDKVSTSYVERFNLSTRMQNRRYTRLTNGFSKTASNHEASVGLTIAYYNFCRVHETLRETPAMALGVTRHIWTIGELMDRALAAAPAPDEPPITPSMMKPGRKPFQLRVIRGGRITPRPPRSRKR